MASVHQHEPASPNDLRAAVDRVYRDESRRVFATLVRLLGDFDLAEEATHEAFAAAVERWDTQGVPQNPRAWLVSAGRFRGIDAIRRRARADASAREMAARTPGARAALGLGEPGDESAIEDDRLRLIFTCCHPALAPEARAALTLREVCGLTTEEVASAFLTKASTVAQRIVRAKAKIREEGIPYEVPAPEELPERLGAVLGVVYLVFNEGYTASSGDRVTRGDLADEAIRLGRLLAELHADPEVDGLLALMLIQDSRRLARTTESGDLVLLEDQDRSRWNRERIREGVAMVEKAMASGRPGSYALQAAIGAEHAKSASAAGTDWARIVSLYELLRRTTPSPVVDLNHAVAVAMRDGPAAGLGLIDALLGRGELGEYRLAHAARADLLRRLGRPVEAREAYERALTLTHQGPERRFLEGRLRELG